MRYSVGAAYNNTEVYHPPTKKFRSFPIDIEGFIFHEADMASVVSGLTSDFPMNNSHAEKDTLEVKADIRHRSEELILKIVDNFVGVTGKRKHDENTRESVQRCALPDVIPDKVTCFSCTPEGIINILNPM